MAEDEQNAVASYDKIDGGAEIPNQGGHTVGQRVTGPNLKPSDEQIGVKSHDRCQQGNQQH